jgi:hypothetical protein
MDPRVEVEILETALDGAYRILDEIARQNVLPKNLQSEIKRLLPRRFESSFSFERPNRS